MNLPRLEPQVVKFLKAKLPLLEYKLHMSRDDYLDQDIYRAGQLDVIHRMEKIIKEQEKGGA